MVYNSSPKSRAGWKKLLALAFWLVVWQLAAWQVGERVLLAGPVETLRVLGQLMLQSEFWARTAHTMLRVLCGAALATAAGVLLAAAGAASPALRSLIAVPMQLIKAAPVASFIILALLWVRSRWLSVLISFLIGLPVVYAAVLQAIQSANQELLEMAQVFQLPFLRTLRAIWLPQVLPGFAQSCRTALGLCFKSGVAAEVIGLPSGSIGEALYNAKLTLATGELFAWTMAIICASAVTEKLLEWCLSALARRFGCGEGML